MRIDFATLAFGYTVKVGGGTPNWATALGQGKEYKINDSREINELLKGLVYTSVPLSKVSTKIGKGGKITSGSADNSPIIVSSVFNKVSINNKPIINGKFILLVTRDDSKSHPGRLRIKYGPSNTYADGDETYSNEKFWEKAKNQLKLSADACFFVYDISVLNQDELILKTIIVNPDGEKQYYDTKDQHAQWDKLIEEDEKKNDDVQDSNFDLIDEEITPEWFNEKAINFPNFDNLATQAVDGFLKLFSPGRLQDLSGSGLLDYIFLNPNNKTSLCYMLEFNDENRELFGSIKSGTAYKYGLFYSQKNGSWVTGSSVKPRFLSDDEAMVLGTQIRDYLLAGVDTIIDHSREIYTLDDYQKLYIDLNDITDGFINKVWFLKYYSILFPEIFPPIYSQYAQKTVLNTLKIESGDNPIYRMGQIKTYVDECKITNVMFNKIFWTYCNGDDNMKNDYFDEKQKLKNCLEIKRNPDTSRCNPLNSIVYGAPGTGKTYSMVERALAIIDNTTYSDFLDKNQNRSQNVTRYKDYVKTGQIVFVTFHQSYGYEEFIQGLRPDVDSETMSFITVDGVFKTIADKALNDKNNKYVIIIDEINRANISKVFGELITLIEEDKRWGENNETCVTLQSGDIFAVPNNLYIIGTMNSADKSISLIDAALRRRFSFIEQPPEYTLVTEDTPHKVLVEINKILVNELDSTDLLVGHSYFMNKKSSDLKDILNNNIIPLLYEYFYDNRKKVAEVLTEVIAKTGAPIEIVNNEVGRIKVKNKEKVNDSQ